MVGDFTAAQNKMPKGDGHDVMGPDGLAHPIVAVAAGVLAEVDAALSAGAGTASAFAVTAPHATTTVAIPGAVDLLGLSAALGGGQQLG